MTEHISLPKADLTDFISDYNYRRNKFINIIKEALSKYGIFSVVNANHEFDKLKPDIFNNLNLFSLLSPAKKQMYSFSDNFEQRGYIDERIVEKIIIGPSFKEDFRDELLLNYVRYKFYLPNIPIREVKNLVPLSEKLLFSLSDIDRLVLQAIALSLDLEKENFNSKIAYGDSPLELLIHSPLIKRQSDLYIPVRTNLEFAAVVSPNCPSQLFLDGRSFDVDKDELVYIAGNYLSYETKEKFRNPENCYLKISENLKNSSQFALMHYVRPRPRALVYDFHDDFSGKDYSDVWFEHLKVKGYLNGTHENWKSSFSKTSFTDEEFVIGILNWELKHRTYNLSKVYPVYMLQFLKQISL
ncbi:hypothetical protein J4440_01600 [Candidatus Woesearchaeota archaeon]|nr:hypothetical protein [Candidatus Woesearchaeota archaeon]